MKRNGSLVSVVTPAYNSEATLRRCVDSVLAQTHQEWDLTIVNNRSTDGTLEIAREYAEKDRRIRVITNDVFVPIIANYNNAVRATSRESGYCKVLAADDRLDPECLAKMVTLAEANPNVAIVGALGYGFDGRGIVWDGLPYPQTVFSGREVCRMLLLGLCYVFGTQTSVLYRAELVRSRDRFFNENSLHSDPEVCLEFLRDRDFGFIHQVLTEQGADDGSTTSYSKSMNTYLPNSLFLLKTYGPWYLSPEELAERNRAVFRSYYAFLARQLLKRRDDRFWKFHREALQEMGFELSRQRLARSLARLALDVVLEPKPVIKWSSKWVSGVVRGRPKPM